ncbi:type IV toxin-antitoxin system AbiEi family antitoxin domain-containing protein [Arthrobacter sp. FB24]|uniref:type IV toxin-antitoxin system AbiEi family antitoxin domain-containing protein n=1 Tax=Arthrobacter sp. (strain FB24) TaxID=290399 RepID=UPI0005BD8712|nr:type IV toxin-antitoxin system AbiEi family antitoxin domain-containing protein [Arthrobacter sp. FB24]
MNDLPTLLLARDRLLHGLTAKDLARRAASGALVRIRHGVYVDGPAWRELVPWEQYRLRVQAAAETHHSPTVFARHSAASVWKIPTMGVRHPVQALTLKNDGGRSRAGVRRYFADPSGLTVVRREGLLVTDRIRTVLDLAAFTPFTEAAVPLDHVLKPDRTGGLRALTLDNLTAGIGSNYTGAAQRRIRAALSFADPLSGSAGESYSRSLMHVAGFEPPVLQQAVYDSDGLVGYADFYWKQAKVVGEFDGVAKYLKPEYLKGRTPSQAVVDEKYRENRIRAAGFKVVRWDWADLMEPGRLERMLAAGGVPRRRARSAILDARNAP